MKKTYIIPETESMHAHTEHLLAASGITSSNGIIYGGIDEEGELDPSVKESIFDFVWE